MEARGWELSNGCVYCRDLKRISTSFMNGNDFDEAFKSRVLNGFLKNTIDPLNFYKFFMNGIQGQVKTVPGKR